MSKELINDIFNRVKFDEIDRDMHSFLYNKFKQIAELMDDKAPECEDKTLAFKAMHLSLMHYGSALSKKDKYKI